MALGGVAFDPLTEPDVVSVVETAFARGAGGTIVTPNVDILRQARRDHEAHALIVRSSLVLADGMPLVWASKLSRRPLPARVAGSDLIWSLSAMAARHGKSIYLLGGATGVPQRAAKVLSSTCPGLIVAGADSPPFGFDQTPDGLETAISLVKAAKPDLVFVGLGFPRQERLIAKLVTELPTAWFVGCGAAIAFAAGEVSRAPRWMRGTGLEWVHRLASEPRRLFRRYLLQDVPYAVRLLTSALLTRLGKADPQPPR
ncbi:MAG: WecB/TagA/CpsF family glycosyltransferase [Micromonosporaceae bacterium]